MSESILDGWLVGYGWREDEVDFMDGDGDGGGDGLVLLRFFFFFYSPLKGVRSLFF